MLQVSHLTILPTTKLHHPIIPATKLLPPPNVTIAGLHNHQNPHLHREPNKEHDYRDLLFILASPESCCHGDRFLTLVNCKFILLIRITNFASKNGDDRTAKFRECVR
nr:hypothetical protein [Tanacetum cinerariifolium]